MYKLIEPQNLVEPVTLLQVKRWLVIDEDYSDEDEDLALLISACRARMEKHLNVALCDRAGLMYVVSSLAGRHNLRVPFLSQASNITVIDDGGEPVPHTINSFVSIHFYGDVTTTITYNVSKATDAALLVCLRNLIATAYKYREDMTSEAVNTLMESSLDKVEIFSNNPLI